MDACSFRLLLILLFICMVIIVTGQDCSGSYIIQNLQREKQLSQAFHTVELIGLPQCSKKCLTRSKCQVISFNFDTLTCELGEDVSYITASSLNASGTISRSTLLQFESFLLNSCVGHSCDVDSVCVELSNGQSTCVLTITYVAPTTTTTTSTTTTPTTTTTTTTTTPPPTTTTPPPTTTTTTPTTTTTTTTPAEILCGNLPPVQYANTPTSAERSVGTSLSYTCFTDHLQNGDQTVICQANGQWLPPTLTCIPCDPAVFTYNADNQFCYKLELVTRYSNTDAKSYCAGLGGRLAQVDTTQKLNLLVPLLPATSQFYVDGSDSVSENTWIYSDGSSVNLNLFKVGMPTMNNLLNCMIIQANAGKMAEIDCSLNRFVICDKELT